MEAGKRPPYISQKEKTDACLILHRSEVKFRFDVREFGRGNVLAIEVVHDTRESQRKRGRRV